MFLILINICIIIEDVKLSINAPKWPISPKMAIFKHVGNGQNVSLELISVDQTIMGDPNNGLDELEPNQSYLNHFPTWYEQYGHFYLFLVIFAL